jgi:hypothetical protein
LAISRPGLPDFSWRNIPKLGKIPQNSWNDQREYQLLIHKIHRMAIKYTKIFRCKAFQNISKLGFLD